VNPQSGIAASAAVSGAPRFPCGAALAAAAQGARCRNVANAARVAVAGLVASGEMWDRSGARAVADRAAVRDGGSAIDRSDGLGPAADRTAVHRTVVAAGQADNYAAAADYFSAPAADNFFLVAIHNSVAVVIDSCAAQNYAPAGTGIGAGLEAGWILAANGWVPVGKDAAENRYDDFAQGTAPLPKPAS
jgi:hypothetical protein